MPFLSPTWKSWAMPSVCALCGAATDSADHLCGKCRESLPKLGSHCPICATPTEHGEVCGACLKRPPPFSATFAEFRYAFPLDRLIQDLKYNGQLALTQTLSALIKVALDARPDDAARLTAIVAMPLAKRRQIERGFNQSQELAKPLAKALRLPLLSDALARVKETPKQSEAPSWEDRAKNMRDAFAATQPLNGQRILLIDDVMTSGATARAAAITLKRAGAESVSVALVARTVRN